MSNLTKGGFIFFRRNKIITFVSEISYLVMCKKGGIILEFKEIDSGILIVLILLGSIAILSIMFLIRKLVYRSKARVNISTQTVCNMLELDISNELKLGSSRLLLIRFLKNAIPRGFELGETPIETFLEDENKGEILDGFAEEAKLIVKKGIKRLQRVYQISPSLDSMKALLSNGIDSAYDVVKFSEEEFLFQYGHIFPSFEEARLIYYKSQKVGTAPRT